MQGFRVETERDTEYVTRFLEDKLYDHNSGKIGKRDGRLFSSVVRDENGSIVAGVAGWTWAGACEITQLWVDERLRNRGIGTMLLGAAEKEASSSKCTTILVRTYAFQAPKFYEKSGYAVEHVMEDFPAGYRYYTLTKTL